MQSQFRIKTFSEIASCFRLKYENSRNLFANNSLRHRNLDCYEKMSLIIKTGLIFKNQFILRI